MPTDPTPSRLAEQIRHWGTELGLQDIGFTGIDLGQAEQRLLDWLDQQRHGEMQFMARHGTLRSRPAQLLPGTLRIICARLNYLPSPEAGRLPRNLPDDRALISCYAWGRDYHKLLRKRLEQLAGKIRAITDHQYRVFVDSAPVLEKPLAEQAGLGWIGKHTNLIHRRAGSWFFLGEIFTDLPLPLDRPASPHCGHCRACLDICPTQAIIAPYELDARRCISYLTIELRGPIPVELRPAIGRHLYGCDDCQQVCPWNRFARVTAERDFLPRHGFDQASVTELIGWSEAEFLRRTEGSAIRRIGHACWLRNCAIVLGNSPPSPAALQALRQHEDHPLEWVREHVRWALTRLQNTMRPTCGRPELQTHAHLRTGPDGVLSPAIPVAPLAPQPSGASHETQPFGGTAGQPALSAAVPHPVSGGLE